MCEVEPLFEAPRDEVVKESLLFVLELVRCARDARV